MDSILNSVKKLLGISTDLTAFDTDIVIHINSALMSLSQLGIGPKEGYRISDNKATWNGFLGNSENLEAVKSYVYMKVRLIFDPPTNSFVIDAFKKEIAELEWRLNVQVEGGSTNE